MVVGEVVPGIAVFAVVLTHRAPLPLAQVGPPFLPRDSRLARVVQAFLLSDIDNLSGHVSPPPLSYSGWDSCRSAGPAQSRGAAVRRRSPGPVLAPAIRARAGLVMAEGVELGSRLRHVISRLRTGRARRTIGEISGICQDLQPW